MKKLEEALEGFSMGGPGSLLKNIGSLGILGDAAMNAISGKDKTIHSKHSSNIDEAIKSEMERHKEGHKQRSEHGQY